MIRVLQASAAATVYTACDVTDDLMLQGGGCGFFGRVFFDAVPGC